mmetsp:Transcript_24388/g.68538  ORF Transcript_24388/g.68538 Transcript_24388/m.68538 type:complete len:288 (-) Transcript_24388:118-981(-)
MADPVATHRCQTPFRQVEQRVWRIGHRTDGIAAEREYEIGGLPSCFQRAGMHQPGQGNRCHGAIEVPGCQDRAGCMPVGTAHEGGCARFGRRLSGRVRTQNVRPDWYRLSVGQGGFAQFHATVPERRRDDRSCDDGKRNIRQISGPIRGRNSGNRASCWIGGGDQVLGGHWDGQGGKVRARIGRVLAQTHERGGGSQHTRTAGGSGKSGHLRVHRGWHTSQRSQHVLGYGGRCRPSWSSLLPTLASDTGYFALCPGKSVYLQHERRHRPIHRKIEKHHRILRQSFIQ